MAFKFVVLSCLVAIASAGLIPTEQVSYSAPYTAYSSEAVHAAPIAYSAPVTKYATPITYAAPITKYAAPVTYAKVANVAAVAPVTKVEAYEPSHAQYSYSYDVQDSHTGDSKSQHETRDGDVVHGSYSVVDPDGVKRTVEYTADPHNGFNAVVHREPLAHVTKVLAPVAKYATPVQYAATPVAYSAPEYAYHH